MTISIVSKTNVQKSTHKNFSGVASSLGTFVIYTCPTGKKAQCHGTLAFNGFGTGTAVRMRGGNNAKVCNIVSQMSVEDRQIVREADFVLNEGETCSVSCNLGTTGSVDYTLDVQELPA